MEQPTDQTASLTPAVHDSVDRIVRQWRTELPALDPSPLGVVARLARYGRLVARAVDENLLEFGLNETKFNMLAALRRSGSPFQLTPKELSGAMLLSSGALTYVINQMEVAGLIRRVLNKADRRQPLVTLTPEGQHLIERAVHSHVRLCRELLMPLPEDKVDDLAELLKELLIFLDPAVDSEADRPFGR